MAYSNSARSLFVGSAVGALLAAHRTSWVHCDVKPCNFVFVSSKRQAVIIDWGSAHALLEGSKVARIVKFSGTCQSGCQSIEIGVVPVAVESQGLAGGGDG